MSQFYNWLQQQQTRSDAIGDYARAAMVNVTYPRSSRLLVLLKYEPKESRRTLKRAHKEWRKQHDQAGAA